MRCTLFLNKFAIVAFEVLSRNEYELIVLDKMTSLYELYTDFTVIALASVSAAYKLTHKFKRIPSQFVDDLIKKSSNVLVYFKIYDYL